MILKNTEDDNLTLHVRLYLPEQVDIDKDDAEMDLWIKTGSNVEHDIDGGHILNIKDVLLEAAEDSDSSAAIISWLEFFKNEVQKKLNVYNSEITGRGQEDKQ